MSNIYPCKSFKGWNAGNDSQFLTSTKSRILWKLSDGSSTVMSTTSGCAIKCE